MVLSYSCVSYPFLVAPMHLTVRTNLPDAPDFILEVLASWIQVGTEHEMEELLECRTNFFSYIKSRWVVATRKRYCLVAGTVG